MGVWFERVPCVLSSLVIFLLRKSELVDSLGLCLDFLCPVLMGSRFNLQYVFVAFPGHTYLLFDFKIQCSAFFHKNDFVVISAKL